MNNDAPSRPSRAGGVTTGEAMNNDNDTIRLSFILPTTGRPSIARMLDSILEQGLRKDDEIMIAGSVTDEIKERYASEWNIVFYYHAPGKDWGHTERNTLMQYAAGTHLVFVDDDDAMLPGSIDAIRSTVRMHPHLPHMFKMISHNGQVLWLTPEIKQGNHGTPQFVVPNRPDSLGRWGNRYEGDYDFVRSTLNLYGGNQAVIWSSHIIYGCREFGDSVPNGDGTFTLKIRG